MNVTPDTLGAPETKMQESLTRESRLLEAFEAFKEANDERLGEIERKQSADVLLEEKVERLNSAMDAMITKARRPALASSETGDFRVAEHKSAFNAYVRTGEANALRMLEAKALNGAIAPDSGYLLPMEAEAAILQRMAALSPMRQVAMVGSVSV
jgi:HK97 family phage major capsid protein